MAEEGLISTAVAARLIMCTPVWLRRLSQMGYFPDHGKDQWNLVEVVQGHIKYLKDESRRSTKSAAATRIQDARAADMELRTAERQRRLVPVDDAIAVVDDVVGCCRAEFSSLPARYTRDLAARTQLETMIDGSLARISDTLDERAAALRAGGVLNEAGRPYNS